MIKPETVKVIKSTLPVLQQHGETLTSLFYTRMFENNPEVKMFFNQAHQHIGTQQRALAAAICAYAEHIETPEKLSEAVELIAQKHASLGIKAEHYPIVGANLIGAIKELLGDAATDEIISAWEEAYTALVTIFVNREQAIYDAHLDKYGWQGFKAFNVIQREDNSSNISSFYLQPQDGSKVTPHIAGQYITVKRQTADGTSTLRNYSLSNYPGTEYYRISVKRELSTDVTIPHGLVSNDIHDNIMQGDTLFIAPPCGEFTLSDRKEQQQDPIVFIAGGVGITPLLSMLHAVLRDNRNSPITLIQAAVNGETHAFSEEIQALCNQHANFTWHVRYSAPNALDRKNKRFDSEGLIDNDLIRPLAEASSKTHYYLCGPEPMLKHCYSVLRNHSVTAEQIYYEFFGPKDNLEK